MSDAAELIQRLEEANEMGIEISKQAGNPSIWIEVVTCGVCVRGRKRIVGIKEPLEYQQTLTWEQLTDATINPLRQAIQRVVARLQRQELTEAGSAGAEQDEFPGS